MKKKLIEKIILIVVALVVAVVLTVIPLTSYFGYQDYLADIEAKQEELENAHKKPTLNSIKATLKKGVQYYANDTATAVPEHFDVIGNFTNASGKTYDEAIEPDKFTVSTAVDFYKVGGDITITYKNKTSVITVQLVPVVLEKVEIAVTPYTIKYQVGSTFSTDGMTVNAVYNDGTVKKLSTSEYTVDKTGALTTSDNKVAISYTDGQTTKTANLSIGVVQTLNNGAVKSIMVVNDQAIVHSGQLITTAELEVNAVYESGNRVRLNPDEYTINGSTETANFGKQYPMEIVYNADTTKKVNTVATIRTINQAEEVFYTGGKIVKETEYIVSGGSLVATSTTANVLGSFSAAVKSGSEASFWREFNCSTETVASVTMRCGNSNCQYVNGVDKTGGYIMKPLQVNTIMDLTVNGVKVAIPSTVILKGCGPYMDGYAPLYGVYSEFTIPNVPIKPGKNVMKFSFKNSTIGETNCWGESPSTMNVDYFTVDTKGNEIPENYTIKALEFNGDEKLEYGTAIADTSFPMTATLSNGTRILLSASQVKSLCNITAEGGTGKDYYEFAKYKVTATLKTDAKVSASKEITIAKYYHTKVLKAEIVLENNKVYYVLTGENVGYEANQLVFWDKLDDNSVYNFPATVTLGVTTFTMKIELTSIDLNKIFREDKNQYVIYPHLEVGGVPYINGKNANGDITNNYTSYQKGQMVDFNGKRYRIYEEWSMPTVVISNL